MARMKQANNTNQDICTVLTSNAVMTEKLAEKIGTRLKGGEVIELVSDLGGGKTTFVRGLARGMGSGENVSSPTFKICNVYSAGQKQLYHYDFYRLKEAGLIEHELAEGLDEPTAVVIVEWGDVVSHVLPEKRLTIHIRATGENSRSLSINGPEDLQYLTEGLC
jgi:tRNA threonylcarbamoyladenosine biosynthesis protein TsaE